MKILLFFLLLLPTITYAKVSLVNLTVEGRSTPQGIDINTPRFGWQIRSDRRNVKQQAYRILVASSKEHMSRNEGDIWDSGTVSSDSSQWVSYKGKPLLPNCHYYWKVIVKTNKGKTAWSDTNYWTTGLMDETNWKGCWIGIDKLVEGDRETRHSRIVTRLLRKEFTAKKKIKRATIHISGLGLYTLYINGKRVGEHVLTPVPTDYTKTVAYDSYDVTPLITTHNAIGVMLAGGRYFAPTQNYQTNVRTTYGYPKLIANLIIEYQNGHSETISTDSTWRLSTDGPIRYANDYDGELFDARRIIDFSLPQFDDSHWKYASTVSAPGGLLRGNITPAMSVYQTEHPTSIRKYGQRVIIDFGTNNAGRIRIDVKGLRGDTIRIRHAELLNSGDSTLYTRNLRSAEATAYYVSDGKQRSWTPEFTYYGFRYAEITVLNGRPDQSETPSIIEECIKLNQIQRELIADHMDETGTGFYVEEANGTSLLNDIVSNARRGIRSNYKGMPIDCPQRDERMPWLGDRTTGCFGESYLMNNHALYSKWTTDICESQRKDGALSDVAPAYWRLYRTNITWPAALAFASNMLYRQYGDLSPMRNNYNAIKKHLALIRRTIYKDGLVIKDTYGDWCVPPESKNLVHSKDPARKTDGVLIASAYYFYICRTMQHYATLFNLKEDALYYSAEAEKTRTAINAKFLTNGNYSNGTATANLLPLAMEIVPDSCKKSVTDNLLHTISVKNDTHLSTGVIGIQWIMRLLSDIGQGEMAYKLAVTDTYPSWGYMVRHGATTIWELWNGDTANPSMNSGNHVMLLGDLLVWCYEHLGGIRPDGKHPGFKHIVLKPDFSIKALHRVEASHPSPYGIIRSSWIRNGNTIIWNIKIPDNTTAELHIPNKKIKYIGSGEYKLKIKNPY